MAEFNIRKQIEEDIEDYQTRLSHIKNISKPEWAFNFWILDKLFKIDEDVIESYIVDYNDKGIDCYVWHEESGDLYLIQNKYFSEDNRSLSNEYIQNDFLTRAIGALEKDSYSRDSDLQQIYNRNSSRDDFMIHYHLYVTNNVSKSDAIMNGIKKFNEYNCPHVAEIYGLDDIGNLYFGEPIKDKQTFKFTLTTINKGTVLSVDNINYDLGLNIDARYSLVPVYKLYEMCKKAKEKEYALYEANIREYLGTSGSVNKKIMETLRNPKDRVNFFFYNNGITIIADQISKVEKKGKISEFEIINPQIVNGCQTVSTIYETLNSLSVNSLEEEFKNTYVMVKVLSIPSKEDSSMAKLYHDIVTYNNSQNAINQKTFAASADEFKRIQSEFERKGFLLCIKQSDKHQFKEKYKKSSSLRQKNADLLEKFGLTELDKPSDFMIDLEKLLQIITAFTKGAQDAIQKKSQMLKAGSVYNTTSINFIRNITISMLLDLYLLYLRAEREKKRSKDGKTPNPFYLIDCFSRYDCNQNPDKIGSNLDDKEKINKIITLYKISFKFYFAKWKKDNNNDDYNKMIKSPINYDTLSEAVDAQREALE